jgi:ubiquitin-like modifier-activating enzyme ATG7
MDIYSRLHAPAPSQEEIGSAQAGQENAGVGTSILGLVPHQLRGYLAQFRNMLITGSAYDRCTGCSEIVSFDLLKGECCGDI